jgi:hypothetical protein
MQPKFLEVAKIICGVINHQNSQSRQLQQQEQRTQQILSQSIAGSASVDKCLVNSSMKQPVETPSQFSSGKQMVSRSG